MKLADKVVVITGAASGVGAAAAIRFAAEGARLVLTDINDAPLRAMADQVGAVHLAGNICDEAVVGKVAALARSTHGRIDIWFSNAGSSGRPDDPIIAANPVWQSAWDLHVMAHVYAARAVLPEMIARGDGYLLQTASSVALSLQLDRAHYTVTKHAALSFSEWLAANYRPQGICVSCFCPGAMDTPMLRASGLRDDHPAFLHALQPEQVAELLVRGIEAEKFLIGDNGPTDGAREFARKSTDYDSWIASMGEQRNR